MTKVDELVNVHGLYLLTKVSQQIRRQLDASLT